VYTSRHIVRLIDVGWNNEASHYVMEYWRSGALAHTFGGRPLPVNEAVRMRKAC